MIWNLKSYDLHLSIQPVHRREKTLVSFESKKTPEVYLNRKIQHFTVYPREQGGNLLCLAKYPAQLGQTQNEIELLTNSYAYNYI